MADKSEFIRFCGRLVFDPDNAGWETLSSERQREYCMLAQKTEWALLFVRVLNDRLPEPFYGEFRRRYRQQSLKRMVESRELSEFYRLLEAERIPFIPIKGADLAFRIYPDPALRPHDDWDVLFHKADCPRLIGLLQETGWKAFPGYEPDDAMSFHYARMHLRGQALEPHWTLPLATDAAVEEAWRGSEEISECHRVLSREMNLLLIVAHASVEDYAHVREDKFLLDAGMVLKGGSVDWNRMRRLADCWKIVWPDVFFGAWSEFFPDGVLPEGESDSVRQNLIREIFALQKVARKASRYEKGVMTFDLRRLYGWLTFYTPSSIRQKYELKRDQHWRIFWCAVCDFCQKVFFCLLHNKRENPELQRYYRSVAELDRLTGRPDGKRRLKTDT